MIHNCLNSSLELAISFLELLEHSKTVSSNNLWELLVSANISVLEEWEKANCNYRETNEYHFKGDLLLYIRDDFN